MSIIRKNRGARVRRESVRKRQLRQSQKQVFRQILGFQIHLSRKRMGNPSSRTPKYLLLPSINRRFLRQLHLLSHLLSYDKCQNASTVLRSNHHKSLHLAPMLSRMLRLKLRLKTLPDHTSCLWLRHWMSS